MCIYVIILLMKLQETNRILQINLHKYSYKSSNVEHLTEFIYSYIFVAFICYYNTHHSANHYHMQCRITVKWVLGNLQIKFESNIENILPRKFIWKCCLQNVSLLFRSQCNEIHWLSSVNHVVTAWNFLQAENVICMLLIVYSNQIPILNCTGFCPKHGHLHKNTTSIEMQIFTRNGKQMHFYAEMQNISFRNYTSN